MSPALGRALSGGLVGEGNAPCGPACAVLRAGPGRDRPLPDYERTKRFSILCSLNVNSEQRLPLLPSAFGIATGEEQQCFRRKTGRPMGVRIEPALQRCRAGWAALALAVSSRPNDTNDEHFAELRAHFSDDQIVEMVACLSVGAFLNTWNDTMATTLEEVSAQSAERELGARAGNTYSVSCPGPVLARSYCPIEMRRGSALA